MRQAMDRFVAAILCDNAMWLITSDLQWETIGND